MRMYVGSILAINTLCMLLVRIPLAFVISIHWECILDFSAYIIIVTEEVMHYARR